MQDCPASGVLWAEAIALAPRPTRRSKATDALKRCDNDPFVVAAVAQLFWADRKVSVMTTLGSKALPSLWLRHARGSCPISPRHGGVCGAAVLVGNTGKTGNLATLWIAR